MADDQLGSVGSASFDVTADFSKLTADTKAVEAELAERFTQLGVTAGDALTKGLGEGGAKAAGGLKPVSEEVAHLGEAGHGTFLSLDKLGEEVAHMAAAFSLAGVILKSAEMLKEFAAEAFATGSVMVDMAAKTGMSMHVLEELQYIGLQTGTSLESLTNAAFMLGTRLEGGDRSIVNAVQHLGLSFEELARMSPDEQFMAVVEALQAMGSETDRNRVGMDLFGRSYRTIVPAMAEDFEHLTAGMTSNTDQQLHALDRADDRWHVFWENRKREVAGEMGNLILAFDALGTGIHGAKAASDEYDKSGKDLGKMLAEGDGLLKTFTFGWVGLDTVLAGAGTSIKQLSDNHRLLTDEEKRTIETMVALGRGNAEIEAQVKKATKSVVEYADSLRNRVTPDQVAGQIASDALAESQRQLTPAIVAAANAMLKAGFSADEVFSRLKDGKAVTEQDKAAIDKLGDAHTAAAAKIKKAAEDEATAAKKRQDAQKASEASVDTLTDATKKHVLSLHDQQLSEEQIATLLGLLPVQVAQVVKAEQDREKVSAENAKEQAKRHEEELKRADELMDKFFQVIGDIDKQERDWQDASNKRTMSEFDYKATKIEEWRTKEVKALEATGVSHEDAMARVQHAVDIAYTNIAIESSQTASKMAVDAQHVGSQWQDVLDGIPQLLEDAFKGGGGLEGAIKGLFAKIGGIAGHGITDSIVGSGAIDKVSTGMGKMLGVSTLKAGGFISSIMSAGLSTAITAGLSALASALGGKPVWKQLMGSIGQEWGAQISEGLAKSIEDTAASGVVHSMEAAKLVHMKEILEAAGGVTVKNFSVQVQHLHDVFQQLSVGALNVAQAEKIMTENWDAFAKAGTDSLGIVSNKLREIMYLDRNMGTNSAAISKYIGDQSADALASFADVAHNMTLRTAAGAHAISGTVEAAYAKVLESSGSVKTATDAIRPIVQDLEAQFEKTGLAGGGAFDALRARIDLLSDATVGPAVQSLQSFGEAIASSYNAGVLGANEFAEMQQELSAQADVVRQALTDQGKDAGTVYQFLKGPLEKILDIHQQTGWAIDGETQGLVDQARAEGTLGKEIQSVQDVLQEGFTALIEALGGELPDAWKKFTDGANEAADAVGRVADGTNVIGVPGGDFNEVPLFAAGGVATRPTMGVFGEAGPEALVPLDQYDAMRQGAAASGGDMGVANIYLDGRLLARATLKRQKSELRRAGLAN